MNRAGGTFVSPTILPESATSSSAGASAAADVPTTDVDTGRTSVSPSTVRAGGTSLRAGGAFLSVASAKVEVPPVSDHEHALPSLADIAAVGPAALSTPPMLVEAAEIAPLAPIAPMNIPALDAGEGERR